MFIRYSMEARVFPYKKKASTDFRKGALCSIDANGFLIEAVQADVSATIVGICQEDVNATLNGATDYASTRDLSVDVPIRKLDWFAADVGTGTPAQTDVGESVEIDDALLIDVVATTNPLVRVERYLSATQVIVSIL